MPFIEDDDDPATDDDPSDVDSDDEEETALVAQEVETEAMLTGVGSLAPNTSHAEDVAHRQAEHEGSTLQYMFRQELQRPDRPITLPPISIIFEAIDGDTRPRRQRLPDEYRVWSVIRRSLGKLRVGPGSVPPARVPMDNAPRTFRHIVIDSNALPTLNARRILSPVIVASFSELLLQDHCQFPLMTGDERPSVWVAPPCAAHLSPSLLLYLFFKVSFDYLVR